MGEDRKLVHSKIKLIVVIILLFILIFSYLTIVIYNYVRINNYSNMVLPNSYLGEYKIGNYYIDELETRLISINDKIINKKIIFLCNGREYEYSLKELEVSLDYKKIINDINKYQNNLSYSEKISLLYKNNRKNYSYSFNVDDDTIKNLLTNLKQQVDVSLVDGYFDASNGVVQYISGNDSFSLNIDESLNVVKNNIDEMISGGKSIELIGDSEKSKTNDSYKSIDTKVSSFSTEFNPWISRATNLKTALAYINGAVVEPGEVFSFYKYAGPYNKSGYVFYYEFVGNGVCQIATTIYNTALLGGLEIVKRYPHAAKSVYVPGGLDATVASYSSGWNVDFQFKNTYKYPIYISAYAVGGKAYVEFWSNSNAKEGKTYATESVQIGTRGYTTYLYTYKDGVQIDKSKIATTWYTKD